MLGCARGVDRSENEVPGFGRVHGRLERFHVAHLAHQHDVWVFADGVFHRRLEIHDVDADFALVDQTLVRRVDKFDGVLDGEDMFPHVVVHPVQHAGDRGALAASRDAREQDHALVELAELLHDRREKEALEVGDRALDFSRDHAGIAHLHQHVHAETPRLAVVHNDIRKVAAPRFVVNLAIALADHRIEQFPHAFAGDRLHLQFAERSTNTKDGRFPHLHVQVGTGVLDQLAKDFIDLIIAPIGGFDPDVGCGGHICSLVFFLPIQLAVSRTGTPRPAR